MTNTVLHFTDTHAFGGAERMLLTVLAGTDRRRWRPVLFHHGDAGVAPLVEGARALGVPTRCVPRMRDQRGVMELPRFVRAVRAERPAVFHAHLTWPLRCAHALVGARLAGVPAVVATQQLFRAIRSRRVAWRHRLLSASVDRYVAVSHDMAHALQPVCVRGARHVTVIHNAVEAESFAAGAPGATAPALPAGRSSLPVVLTLARLDAQKGLDHLLAATALVPNATFIVAGDGPRRDQLEALARELGVADRVRFVGYRDDVPALLAGCDLYVLPSLFEGLPVSLLEAMAAGKPVVATAVRGTDEAVLDGATGLLVPPRDPVALAAAIRTVLADPALARRLAEAGRERARREFSAGRMVEQVMELYDELLSSNGERRGH
jgi:glycosyltransferase involved in cell wall biosynthesis